MNYYFNDRRKIPYIVQTTGTAGGYDPRFGAGSSANLTADTLEHGSVSVNASNSRSQR